jgi:thiol-disulfide isomerase/thioredoxin
MTRLGLLIGCFLAVSIPALALQNTGDANAMLQEIRILRPPQVDRSRASDAEYMKTARAEYEAFLDKRSDLIKAFCEKYPDHPEAKSLMLERWMTMSQRGKATEVMADIDKQLAAVTDPAKKADLLYARTMVEMRGAGRKNVAAIGESVENFIKVAPKDERGAELLYGLAQMDSTKQAQLMQRIVADYPSSQMAQRAKGAMRRAEGVGKPFELKFTEAITGKEISMADLKGKVVVIDFWATWCGPCVAEMPKMKQLYAEYKSKGVEFIGVSLDQAESAGGLTKLKEFVKKEGIEWPQYYQGNYWQSDFSSSWGINSIPCVFIIDHEGKLYSTEARGQLEKLIPELIAKRDGKSA